MIAIVEDGKVTYRGNMPNSFRNSNMNCTGLLNLPVPSESAKLKGIFPLEIVKPTFDSVTHRIDGFTDDILKEKVVQIYIVRPLTEDELNRIKESDYRQKIEAEKTHMAIASLIAKEELPADYIQT